MFGTWQGRLPQELKRAGVQNMAEANAYIQERFLPWFNGRMTVAAAEKGSAFVGHGQADLQAILCAQHQRVVAADNTVSFGRRRLQLAPSKWRFSFAKCRVKVCEHIDRTLSVRYGPHVLGWYGQDGMPLADRRVA